MFCILFVRKTEGEEEEELKIRFGEVFQTLGQKIEIKNLSSWKRKLRTLSVKK